jgi:exo-1,4-beta-D-glucosaminidase
MSFMRTFAFFLLAAGLAVAEPRLLLRDGWTLQSSAGGEVYRTTVPSTVVGTLVRNKVYPDPYFGMNLRSIPGTSYPISTNFSNKDMPEDSPFRVSWWFRKEFQVPSEYRGKTVWLHFDGINFRANLRLNGRQIASKEEMAGAWRLFEYDVTREIKPADKNLLEVEIFPPQANDLAITFVDWNPLPADKDMGIWRDVWLTATGPARIRFPQVTTHLDSGGGAELTVTAELENTLDHAVDGVLEGQIEKTESVATNVHIEARAKSKVRFPPVRIAKPRLWWPAQVGSQELYPLDLTLKIGNAPSDGASIQFGIREIESVIDDQDHRLFRINGKNILIRGAGYTFDMLLESTPQRQEAELRYIRDMNLNAIRFEGKIEDDHFLELADRYGILIFAGWCCCDHWEKWKNWKDEDHIIAAESLKDQIRRLRSHPSVANWMYGSDNPPPPDVEKMYLQILKDYDWPNPYESSATQKPTSVTGPTGVKMTGPYQYIAPSYWLLDKKNGGAHGFNTETSAGPAVPPLDSLNRMLPADHLWPIDSWWNFHTGGGPFKDLTVFTEALNARYGAATGVEDYAEKAQIMAYEGHRAMFEAFGRNKYTSTGVIQWMLNNAWPSMIWHLYDWYLRPGGSYFGAKKACEPLHVQYSYDDGSIVVVNSYYQPFPGMKVRAKVYNLDMTEAFSRDATVDAGPDSSNRVFSIPELPGLSGTYFVWLALDDPKGKRVSTNFYWLSTKPETLDWDKSDWYHTPTKSFADFTALKNLPMVKLKASSSVQNGHTAVTLENPTHSLAFFVHLKLTKGPNGDEILPILWEDNYFPLLTGEKREIAASYAASDLGGSKPVLVVDGWNVSRQ